MKIGINTFGCDHGRSGIGSYILSLVKNLPEGIDDSIALFGPELDRYTYSSGIDSVTYSGVHVSDSLLAERAWHITSFPVFARKQKYDAVLFPSGMNLLPIKFDVPVVPVMHEILSDTYNNSDEGLITGFLRMQLKKAAGIIAPSRFVRDDLINHNIPENRIRVIYHGIDTSLFYPRPVQSNEAVLIHPFSIRRPYILYASRVAFPSKCHVQLIQAFELFKKKTGAPHRLVLAGADGVNAEMVHREVIRSSVSSDILLTGYFPHQSLPDLYSASDVCIFPSAAEGVGLPVLEAMACGIPVACARAAALPEVAADAAVFFDQNNPQEIADAIEQLIRTPSGENEAFRRQMIERGLERVSAFSWKTCARETLDFLASTIRS